MKFTVSELIKDIELNDFKVENVSLDVKHGEFKLVLEGGYWFKNSSADPEIMENGGVIRVLDYNSFEARYFSTEDKLWHTLDYEDLESIDEVNEKSYENSVLRLAGTGKISGRWIEYLIKDGISEISFKE